MTVPNVQKGKKPKPPRPPGVPPLGKGSDPALRKTPQALFELLRQYIIARDIPGILSIHDPDAGVVEFEGGVARGAQEIYDLYVDFFATDPVLNARPLQIIEAGGMAIILGDYTLDFKDENGVVQSVTGKFGDMVRQQGNKSWLYLLDNPYAPF
jgi:ketosteroid isomerase-like protein